MQAQGEECGDRLALARDLVAQLESGHDDDATTTIAQLAGFRDSVLFQEVGRLTRELHNAINEFVLEARINDIAHNEMPDAAERLRYVITMTEQAANTTLTAVEAALPLADALKSDSERLSQQWQKFNSRELSVEDFRILSGELGDFFETTQNNSKALHAELEAVLMAQGFQDLTGQVIRKVIDLVGDVESKLVQLIRMTGSAVQLADDTEQKTEQDARAAAIKAEGPAVPGVDKGELVKDQDDVDDLLSSLGF